MSAPPARRLPLAQEVTEELRQEIASGRWPVGTRIPPEPQLIGRLGVSRGTLREAVKALAHAGLLEVRRGDGTYVRSTSEMAGTARRAYREYGEEKVFEVRFALDAQAARLAARAADDDDLAALRALLARRRAAWAAGDAEGWIAADWEFHLKVAEASGNPLLHELYGTFGDVFHGVKMKQRLRDGFDACREAGHEDLVRAIAARDEETAAATVLDNLRYCTTWMQ